MSMAGPGVRKELSEVSGQTGHSGDEEAVSLSEGDGLTGGGGDEGPEA